MDKATMTKELRDKICDACEQRVKEFAVEWRKAPLLWLREIDVQCDLVARLRAVLREQGQDIVAACHEGYDCTDFSRIAAEPYVKCSDGRHYVRPDVVVWDDGDKSKHDIGKGNWPILWACELKYSAGDRGDEDFTRLCDLRSSLLYRGCVLSLTFAPKTEPASLPRFIPGHYSGR